MTLGDIVFCQVQPSQLFYAHIVHNVERRYVHRPKYAIGNIRGHINGWCYREQIVGILVGVQVCWAVLLAPASEKALREGVGDSKGRSLERHGTRPLFAAAGGYSEQSSGA